jgi:hypothetical protein
MLPPPIRMLASACRCRKCFSCLDERVCFTTATNGHSLRLTRFAPSRRAGRPEQSITRSAPNPPTMSRTRLTRSSRNSLMFTVASAPNLRASCSRGFSGAPTAITFARGRRPARPNEATEAYGGKSRCAVRLVERRAAHAQRSASSYRRLNQRIGRWHRHSAHRQRIGSTSAFEQQAPAA